MVSKQLTNTNTLGIPKSLLEAIVEGLRGIPNVDWRCTMVQIVDKEVLTVVPPTTVVTTTILGFAVQEWVYILTLLYTLLMLVRLTVKMCREEIEHRRKLKECEERCEVDERS